MPDITSIFTLNNAAWVLVFVLLMIWNTLDNIKKSAISTEERLDGVRGALGDLYRSQSSTQSRLNDLRSDLDGIRHQSPGQIDLDGIRNTLERIRGDIGRAHSLTQGGINDIWEILGCIPVTQKNPESMLQEISHTLGCVYTNQGYTHGKLDGITNELSELKEGLETIKLTAGIEPLAQVSTGVIHSPQRGDAETL